MEIFLVVRYFLSWPIRQSQFFISSLPLPRHLQLEIDALLLILHVFEPIVQTDRLLTERVSGYAVDTIRQFRPLGYNRRLLPNLETSN